MQLQVFSGAMGQVYVDVGLLLSNAFVLVPIVQEKGILLEYPTNLVLT